LPRRPGETTADIGRQALRGAAESVLATGKQIASAPAFVPGMGRGRLGAAPVEFLPGVRAALERQQEKVAETYGEPTTTAGNVARIVGRLGTDVAQFAMPGEALRLGGLLPKGVKLATRVGQNIAAGAPIDVLQAATPETSIYPLVTGKEGTYPQRLGMELLADVGLSAGIEALLIKLAIRP